jgi:hypothetical protein
MISLVIPIYNEEVLIEKLFRRTTAAMQAITEDFEIVAWMTAAGTAAWKSWSPACTRSQVQGAGIVP